MTLGASTSRTSAARSWYGNHRHLARARGCLEPLGIVLIRPFVYKADLGHRHPAKLIFISARSPLHHPQDREPVAFA